MITPMELLRVLLGPVIVAAFLALLGRLLRWGWLMPLALGAGFLTGYSLLDVPPLPPRDGTDWLYWVMIPITVWGVVDGIMGSRRGAEFGGGIGGNILSGLIGGALLGGLVLMLLKPLITGYVGGLHWGVVSTASLIVAGWGAAMIWLLTGASKRLGNWAVLAGLWLLLSGTAVVVMSSNMRVMGLYGIAAAAAMGPVMVLMGNVRGVRSVTLVALAILAGELVSGRYYPDEGISSVNLLVLGLSPLGLVLAMLVPGKRNWVRGLVGVLLVAIAVAAVTVPTALTAAKAAGEIPGWDEGGMYNRPAGK